MAGTPLSLLLLALLPELAASTRPPPACEAAMDGYCASPALGACAAKIKAMGGALPLVALKDVSASSNASEWRCYSPTCLTPGGGAYRRGSRCRESCTREPALSALLQNCTHPTPPVPGRELRVDAVDIWGAYAGDCGMVRTPELVKTSSRLLLFGQCRHANATAAAVAAPDEARLGLGDNMLTGKAPAQSFVDHPSAGMSSECIWTEIAPCENSPDGHDREHRRRLELG